LISPQIYTAFYVEVHNRVMYRGDRNM